VTVSAVAHEGSGSSVLLVGELNPFGANPYYALYHLPRGSSGNRLRLIMGLSDDAYERRLMKTNLCTGQWDSKRARVNLEILVDGLGSGSAVVLLGSRVRGVARRFLRDRFNVDHDLSFFTGLELDSGSRRRSYVCLPHPSGLCRLWQEPGAVAKARQVLAEFVPWVPWGEDGGASPSPITSDVSSTKEPS
jgi:hypothetical protein